MSESWKVGRSRAGAVLRDVGGGGWGVGGATSRVLLSCHSSSLVSQLLPQWNKIAASAPDATLELRQEEFGKKGGVLNVCWFSQ